LAAFFCFFPAFSAFSAFGAQGLAAGAVSTAAGAAAAGAAGSSATAIVPNDTAAKSATIAIKDLFICTYLRFFIKLLEVLHRIIRATVNIR
jgi:hypothetical protein